MPRQEAERIITEYLSPVFGFALKRCGNVHDAEDLSQEIVTRAFRALLLRDDIEDARKFIWTIAHNTLNSYYRETSRGIVGVPLEEAAEAVSDPGAGPDEALEAEEERNTIRRLQGEIAYLSGLQRRIVIAYYFENRKQADIARELGLPLGTVKWHLFEAKRELKRGMDKMRQPSDLKFNPIHFDSVGMNGKSGTKSLDEFFRSALSQNICYCVRKTAKTVGEIADDLGVSPVYVETEVEFLERYGFLLEKNGRYIVNFLISEPTAELLTMQDRMYKKAAELFANELYDELTGSGILDDPGILCRQTDGPAVPADNARADHNFLLWTLIPFIAAWSGEELTDRKISFEEAATIRADGGQNIVLATVVPDDLRLPEDYVYMKGWCGPMWSADGPGGRMLWQVDSEWSDRKEEGRLMHVSEDALRVIALYDRERKERLSRDEYAWLAEQGCVKTCGDYDGLFEAAWQIVVLENRDIQARLIEIGDRIKRKYQAEFEALKAPYVKAWLDMVPAHLKKVGAYEMQFIFCSDGWFLLHCVAALLRNGKLKLPTQGQRKALTTVLGFWRDERER